MRILLRQSAEASVAKDTLVEAASLTLGRGTNQTLQLPGAMVALEHAEIHPVTSGVYRLTAKASMGVEVNGLAGVRESVLKPGDILGIGGHSLSIGPVAAGADLVVELRLADVNVNAGRAAPQLDLRSGGLSQRKTALVLVAGLLLVGLLIPLLMTALGRLDGLRQWIPTDGFWAAGPVTSGHAHFGHQCETCHAGPFSRIQDDSCTQCHQEVAHHSNDPAIAAINGFAERRCASCHQEHRGEHALIAQNPKLCTDCHANPEDFPGFPTMQKAEDFKRHHPDFRYTVSQLSGKGDRLEAARVAADAQGKIKDVSGSLFPHDSHLVTAGIKGPAGNEKLVCVSCHVPDTARAGFRPLDFEKHCQRCHELQLKTPERTLELPHGQSEASRFLVEMFYLPTAKQQNLVIAPEQAEMSSRRRIGVTESVADAAPTDREIVTEVFEFQVCGKCHLIDTAGEHPRVVPPVLRHTWMPAARFTHAPHNAVPCKDCHAVENSKTGSDLNLPGIQVCRTCHTGTHDAEGVPSTCVSCHTLHRADHLRMGGLAPITTATSTLAEIAPATVPPVETAVPPTP